MPSTFPDYDRMTMPFRCPNCGEGTQKSVAWLKSHSELQCPGCHTTFPILHREHILGVIEMIRKAGSP